MPRAHPEELFDDEEIARQTAWHKLTSLEKSARRGIDVAHVQESLRIGNSSNLKDLPSHPSNLEQKSFAPSDELLAASDRYVFSSARKGQEHKKRTIHEKDYQKMANYALIGRWIDPNEMEPYTGIFPCLSLDLALYGKWNVFLSKGIS